MNSNTSINNTRLIAVCIILFTAFLFLFNTGKRDLWAPDEPRYAQVSKEMRDSGNFIVPHLNSEPYPDKPPLLFWLINLFSIPFGKITALSSRLPSAFAGIGCCLAIFYLGKSLYHNTRIALMASLLLATSSKFLWMAHRVAFDVLLTFFVMMAIVCFYKGYAARHNHSPITPPISPPLQGKDEGEVKKQERRYYTLFYIFMALGVLTKGPIGFILPFCIVLTYLILKKDIRVLKETRPWIGGAIFAFIVFTWVYLASIYGGKEYTYQILSSRMSDDLPVRLPTNIHFIITSQIFLSILYRGVSLSRVSLYTCFPKKDEERYKISCYLLFGLLSFSFSSRLCLEKETSTSFLSIPLQP